MPLKTQKPLANGINTLLAKQIKLLKLGNFMV